MDLLGDLLLEEVVTKYEAKSVGGLESGSVPITAAVVMKSNCNKNGIQGFYVRKQPKRHGLEKKIEGNFKSSCDIGRRDN